MDLKMPNLDGVEATRGIRNKGITTPVIALTAHTMVHEQQQYIQTGFDDLFPIPKTTEVSYP